MKPEGVGGGGPPQHVLQKLADKGKTGNPHVRAFIAEQENAALQEQNAQLQEENKQLKETQLKAAQGLVGILGNLVGAGEGEEVPQDPAVAVTAQPLAAMMNIPMNLVA